MTMYTMCSGLQQQQVGKQVLLVEKAAASFTKKTSKQKLAQPECPETNTARG